MSEPTAPAPGVVWDWNKKVMDGTIDSTYTPSNVPAQIIARATGVTGNNDGSIDDLAVDPTNPNTGHTPEWSNLRSGDPGLPAVQTDDGDSAAAVHTPGALLFSFDR